MRQPVFLATSVAMYSDCRLSVHRGRCDPCSSTLPIGKIITVWFAAALAASLVLSSSSHMVVVLFGVFLFVCFMVSLSASGFYYVFSADKILSDWVVVCLFLFCVWVVCCVLLLCLFFGLFLVVGLFFCCVWLWVGVCFDIFV